MAIQHPSSAASTPALSRPYTMAKPGYGKRSMPDQLPRKADDFALLPARERYVAGFIDHLPDGASMDVKSLAKQLPLYGQQAVGSALKALATAGHLRRVRCLVGELGQVRWVSRTFWSRTARDNEWWAATEVTPAAAPTAPEAEHTAPATAAPEPAAPAPADPLPAAPSPPAPTGDVPAPALTAPSAEPVAPPAPAVSPVVPQQRVTPAPAGHSPAYLALARLGRIDSRLTLSAADCAALESQAAGWLARGVDTDYLTQALVAGLPARVESPVGLVRRRLTDKIPPYVPAAPAPPAPGAPVHRVMLECTGCGAPGRAEALVDGLCRSCRPPARGDAVAPGLPVGRPSEQEVRTLAAGLRDLLKSP
ncbi:MarR family transcriptional regulator [Streptomyces sp. NBC_00059]|uniref:MarR family transcriptional regulator n=1 Tax=Streptomyces sp. NBC_00059 TaxID=2975635 RepID=UPI00224CED4D|nr:MarR family transcriptional regulator [Streptomyces sp. NBC_00059]MCX5412323.1 MarR family transcriptional regulator [Streptomyces sp. NBC_00059]